MRDIWEKKEIGSYSLCALSPNTYQSWPVFTLTYVFFFFSDVSILMHICFTSIPSLLQTVSESRCHRDPGPQENGKQDESPTR